MNISISQMYNQLLNSGCTQQEADDIVDEEQEFDRLSREEIEHERQREEALK